MARLVVLLGAAVLCVAWASGCATVPPPKAVLNLVRGSTPAAGADRTDFNQSVYDDVSRWIERHYYDEHFDGVDWAAEANRHRAAAVAATSDEALYSQINDLLGLLKDRHTHASSREEVATYYRHHGVLIGLRTEQLPDEPGGARLVTEVFPGSPAEEAGVQVGWILRTCDDRVPGEVLGLGRLKEGQAVKCAFTGPSGMSRTVTIQARRMQIPEFLHAEELPGGVLLLRFNEFDMTAARWVHRQLRDHPNASGVIFDLRGNSGGHVFALSYVVNELFPASVGLGVMAHRGERTTWDSVVNLWPSNHYRGPVAVLVSDFTASAAEIFAQLMHDYRRGEVLGTKTAGTVLTSVFWPLRGGGQLQLSVYDYRSPSGKRLEGNGVVPDRTVNPTPYDPRVATDPTILAALADLGHASVPMPGAQDKKPAQ